MTSFIATKEVEEPSDLVKKRMEIQRYQAKSWSNADLEKGTLKGYYPGSLICCSFPHLKDSSNNKVESTAAYLSGVCERDPPASISSVHVSGAVEVAAWTGSSGETDASRSDGFQ